MSIFNQKINRSIDNYKEDLMPKNGKKHILLIETIVDSEYKQKQEYMSKINNFLDCQSDSLFVVRKYILWQKIKKIKIIIDFS